MTIEDIILSNDTRGVSRLRRKLPPDYCRQAARFVLDSRGPVLILTGFYVAPGYETDGPIGAAVLGRALEQSGYTVRYVTDGSTQMMRKLVRGRKKKVIDFPVADFKTSQKNAEKILADVKPGLAIAIERCAMTWNGHYLNMWGKDISDHTAKLDYLFMGVERTVGVGDGGNEIGMGLLYDAIPQISTLPQDPASTSASHLVIASVSNWGAYGLVGYLSILTGKSLLPSIEEEVDMVKKWVDMGGVDGVSGEQIYMVDGFTLEQNSDILARIHREVASL